MQARLKVSNWAKHQHYKDRCPPWIKLATNTFQDYDFSRLQDASKLLAVCIWTLASREQDGTVPHDFRYIKSQCCLGELVEEKHLTELIENGFLVAIEALAECTQNACLEERRDRDRGETDSKSLRSASGSQKPPSNTQKPKASPPKPQLDSQEWTPDSLCQIIATELRITDRWVKVSLSQQVKFMLDDGEDPEKASERIIASGKIYGKSEKFQFGGWRKFVEDRLWESVKASVPRRSAAELARAQLEDGYVEPVPAGVKL